MPIGLDTNSTYPVALICDRQRPDGERPEFLFRFLTARESVVADRRREQISEQIDAAKTEADKDAVYISALAAMDEHFMGVRNMPASFGLESLTWDEFWELFWNYRPAQRLLEIDKKKSASAALSGGAKSAEPAVVVSAKNPQPDPTPAASHAGDATATVANAASVTGQATLS